MSGTWSLLVGAAFPLPKSGVTASRTPVLLLGEVAYPASPSLVPVASVKVSGSARAVPPTPALALLATFEDALDLPVGLLVHQTSLHQRADNIPLVGPVVAGAVAYIALGTWSMRLQGLKVGVVLPAVASYPPLLAFHSRSWASLLGLALLASHPLDGQVIVSSVAY